MKWTAALLLCATLRAHPLGNASVNHYARLVPSADGVALTYALDLAEIPSFELFQAWGFEPRAASRSEIEAKARDQAREWISQLRLTSSGKPVAPRFIDAQVTIADGAGGVLILRVVGHARIAASGNLQYEDPNYAERAGWKEIVIAPGEGVSLTKTSHAAKEVSQVLTKYPEDPTLAPPQDLRGEVTWTSAAVAPPPAIEPVPQPAPVPEPPTAPPPSQSTTVGVGAVVVILIAIAVRKFGRRRR